MQTLISVQRFSILLVLALIWTGCDSADPDPVGPGEEELITTVMMRLVPDDGGATVSVTVFRDLDGDGGDAPVISGINLRDGVTYTGGITLLNEAESPAEDITEEVNEERDEHQFFYIPQGALAGWVTVTYNDTDGNGLPVGLDYTVTVNGGAGEQGFLNVVLSHYDDSPKNGTDRGNESDVDIEVPVTIQ